jgi:Tat protein translocase TatB subunit
MPQVGPLELLLVAAIALIVFGPEKLPGLARNLGRTLNELRRQADDLKREFQAGLDDDIDDPAPGAPPKPTPEDL